MFFPIAADIIFLIDHWYLLINIKLRFPHFRKYFYFTSHSFAGSVALRNAQEYRSTSWSGLSNSVLDCGIESQSHRWTQAHWTTTCCMFQHGFLGYGCGTTSWSIFTSPETFRRNLTCLGSIGRDQEGHQRNRLRWKAFARLAIATQHPGYFGSCGGRSNAVSRCCWHNLLYFAKIFI